MLPYCYGQHHFSSHIYLNGNVEQEHPFSIFADTELIMTATVNRRWFLVQNPHFFFFFPF